MTPILILMCAAVSAATKPIDIQQVACLQDGTIVGTDGLYRLRRWHDGTWGEPEGATEVRELWTAPSGDVYALEGGQTIVRLGPGLHRQEMMLPSKGARSLTLSADGAGSVFAASADKIFRLKADASAVEVGSPPRIQPGSEFRPSQAPVVFPAADDWVACFPTSPFEIDNGMKGACIRAGKSRYTYRVDYGRYSDRTRAMPFVCGDAVVSSTGNQAQARRLSDGRRVGQVSGPARTGSRCLDGVHPLLVGPDRLRVFEGPLLKQPRTEKVRGQIRDVAVCPKDFAVLRDDSTIVLVGRDR